MMSSLLAILIFSITRYNRLINNQHWLFSSCWSDVWSPSIHKGRSSNQWLASAATCRHVTLVRTTGMHGCRKNIWLQRSTLHHHSSIHHLLVGLHSNGLGSILSNLNDWKLHSWSFRGFCTHHRTSLQCRDFTSFLQRLSHFSPRTFHQHRTPSWLCLKLLLWKIVS